MYHINVPYSITVYWPKGFCCNFGEAVELKPVYIALANVTSARLQSPSVGLLAIVGINPFLLYFHSVSFVDNIQK